MSVLEQECKVNLRTISEYKQKILVLEHNMDMSRIQTERVQHRLDMYTQKYSFCTDTINQLENEFIHLQNTLEFCENQVSTAIVHIPFCLCTWK